MLEFRLPSLGAEMDEGTLLEWKVKPGDAVHKGDVVAVVDTSKSAIDVEIWLDGTIDELLVAPQQKVPVGAVLALLREPGETAEKLAAAKQARARKPAAPAATPVVVPGSTAEATVPSAAARRRVSPAARARAATLGLDPATLAGTGPDGAVTLEGIDRAASAQAAKPAKADRATAMRGAIAAAMARSKREIPHYYLAQDIDVSAMLAWLTAHNEARPVHERVLPAAVLLKAVARTLSAYPELNGHWRDGAFVPGPGIHLGVAIALRGGGLIAPAIHDVDRLHVDALMQRLADLVGRARALTLRSSEMSDATITVTHLGDQGVDVVYGVIYPPQVALVGFGRVRERPWVDGGRVVVASVVTASLAADHRASDGHRGALFLGELGRVLQAPGALDEAAA